MSNIRNAREALIARLLQGDGRASQAVRQAAFMNAELGEPLGALVQNVAQDAHSISDQDLVRARSAGLDEDQIFEIVICAAVGEASRQYEAARAALDVASREQ
ncbi:MAG TPA: hypothetical protein VHZ95_09220 [Polyangiales bacterium]|nr:hypothetical protein [Polyangiales bacterium]